MEILKRSGKKVEYDGSKIVLAIQKAMVDINKVNEEIASDIEQDIFNEIENNEIIWSVDDINNEVEILLMKYGEYEVAREFILYRKKKDEERKNQIEYKYLSKDFVGKYKHKKTNMTELGNLVYYRTYSRYLKNKRRREYWYETVARVTDYNVGLAPWKSKDDAIKEAELMYDNIFNLRQFPSGRALWSGGTKTSISNPISQFNCFTKETEFLTKKGIMNFGQFGDGEQVEVLNRNGKWSTSIVKHFGEQEIVKLTLKRKGTKATKVINTTKNHQWFIRKYEKDTHYKLVETKDLKIGDILLKKIANDRTTIDICNIGIQHGIVYGDGTYNKDNDYCLVNLIGSKKDLASYFNDKPTWEDVDADGLLIRQLPNNWKNLPDITMNKQYLKGFLLGLLLTDGRNGTSIRITQKNEAEVKKIRSIFELLGMPTSDIIEDIRTNSNFGDYENPYTFTVYKETIHSDILDKLGCSYVKTPDWVVSSIEETDSIEKTYCVVEPETHSFTLTSGIHTHNCAFSVFDNFEIVNDIAYLLMLGVGFGFSVEKQYVDNLPEVRGDLNVVHLSYSPIKKKARKEATEFNIVGDVMEIVVGDSKLGWSKAIEYLVKCFYAIEFSFINNVMINYNNVRPFGEPLLTFGGTASGHEALEKILVKISNVLLKDNDGKKKISPLDAMDLATIIAEGIVVGGVRRSAEMCLSSDKDKGMMNAKMNLYTQDNDGNWIVNQDIIHRMMSNNSTAYWGKPTKQELKDRFEIIKHSAENNFFNMESAKKRKPNVKGTNPCLRGDMKILTDKGYIEIGKLDGKTVGIVNKDGDITQGKVWLTGEKPTIEIKFSDVERTKIYSTEDHRFMLIDGTECEAKDLHKKRVMPFLKEPSVFDIEYIKYGFIQGDGTLGRLSSEYHKGLEINIGKDDKEIAELFELEHTEEHRHYTNGFNEKLKSLGFSETNTYDREFPKTFDDWTPIQQKSFIRGCYSANGSVINIGRISYKTTSKVFADRLQMYLNENGYNAYITTNKPKKVLFSNGEYLCKESYDINLARYSSIKKFYEEIGFLQRYKVDLLKQKLIEKSPKVMSVKKTNLIEKVYDFSEPVTHWGVIEGYITHNCGEILLDTNSFCNLVTINLMAFVECGVLNKEKLYEAQALNARISYRVTVPTLELPKWDTTQKRDRLLGLSLTGWQDMVNATGINKEEQIIILNNLRSIARESADKYADKLGLNRSELITTVKPEGTLSQLPTVSSGVHFSHSPYYIRRVRINSSDPLVKVCEELGYSIEPEVGQELETCKTKVIEFPVIAPFGKTKYDISAVEQLEIYKMFMEEYVDHNASNTISVRPHEWDEVIEWVYDNWDTIIGVTFLSLDDSFYQLLPYENCTKEEYEERKSKMKEFNPDLLLKYEIREVDDDLIDDECSTGVCGVR